jgi:hypothetical protein
LLFSIKKEEGFCLNTSWKPLRNTLKEQKQEHKNYEINLVRQQIMVMLARLYGIKWQDGYVMEASQEHTKRTERGTQKL